MLTLSREKLEEGNCSTDEVVELVVDYSVRDFPTLR